MKIEHTASTTRRVVTTYSLLLLTALALGACSGRKGSTDGPAARKADTVVPAASQAKAPEKKAEGGTIWEERIGGYQIRWASDDITARRGGSSPQFSLKERAASDWSRGGDSNDSAAVKECVNEQKTKLLSVVGTIVSMERNEYANCPGSAHPSVTTWYAAIDVSKPGDTLRLTDFFEEKDILNALLDDAIVKKTLETASVAKRPKSLDTLLKILADAPGECHYAFTGDLLTRFAFHHLENGSVAVRLGLSHGVEACRGSLTQIGLLLPIPRKLEKFLEGAEKRVEGFLMQDQKKVSGEKTTLFTVD